MVNITINNKEIQVEEGTTILEATKLIGMPVPTLCYLKGIHEIAACRICIVEVEGLSDLIPACDNICTEGMVIYTNTPRVREARKMNLQLLLSQHRINCPMCFRNGTCQLQKVASSLSMKDQYKYHHEYKEEEWDEDAIIIRDESKCIRCYRCVSVCEKVQSVNIWDMVGTGTHTTVGVSGNRDFKDTDCTYCGQCIINCPVNALHSRNESLKIIGHHGILNDKSKTVVVQIAPAVRSAWGETFGISPEIATTGRMVAALKTLGFDYVFDTDFAADLTIMEEGTELLERLKDKDKYKWPMFTSCCPGWVRFLKANYPEMTSQLSTAKSPHMMFGAVIKSYFAEKIGKAPEDIIVVSIMPCTAKKGEIEIENIHDVKEGLKDVDYVLTTRDMCQLIAADQIEIESLPEMEFDKPMQDASGAGVIFGTTGGVMEAALRTASYILEGKNPDPDKAFSDVRAYEDDKPWIEKTYNLGGTPLRIGVASSLSNARELIRALKRHETELDFVEIMACPKGCSGGGGQPIHYNKNYAPIRAKALYDDDKANTLRFSHENKDIQKLYEDFLGKPCDKMSHKLLHTDHEGWKMNLNPFLDDFEEYTR